jgi:hypothetical protein
MGDHFQKKTSPRALGEKILEVDLFVFLWQRWPQLGEAGKNSLQRRRQIQRFQIIAHSAKSLSLQVSSRPAYHGAPTKHL